ncbi:MAG TPA: PTS sugar transporter subunit IIC [Gemmatimonadaceae bacterium]|jgi:mannose/fructose/N-acetylgalactosamine-specific phosphotransferase system component IIC|nr:PTS sugar transporter subunit IIC [Gemmatimonadota bacterium]HNV74249.1 PTS sugar transporter subunit IIC [Gemmatimonadaceae bacterium]HPV76603.1 PTS sugar transporter subunit IIC [Gemmatimonadaceae bacterium]
MNPIEIGAVAVVGAVLGLDVVSFPQAMISRPLVGATLTGAFLGAPEAGLLLGATLECFALESLPVGASRYPEWGSSSAVGGALVSLPAARGAGALLLAVVVTLIWAWVGGWSMVQLRRLNARWARERHEAVARGSRRTVIGLQLYGMTADLVRGWLMTAIGISLGVPLLQFAVARWQTPETLTRGVLMALAGVVAAAATHKVFHVVPGARWYMLGGLALGLLLLGVAR